MTNEMTTAIAIPTGTDLVALFKAPEQMDAILARIESEARSHAPDLSTSTGRKAIASVAAKVARSKTALDDAGKALNESARAQINAVDAERRKLRDRLDALKDEVRKPLTDWEVAEEARVSTLKARVERVRLAHEMLPPDYTAEQAAALVARVEAIAIDDTWAEFTTEAARYKDQALATLRMMLADATKRETEAAELARLREEAAARAEADRQREEAERAEAARVAAEKAEAGRLARIKAEAEAQAKAEAERAVRAAQEAAEKAEREAIEREAAIRAEADAAAAKAARDLVEAQAATERAAQVERDRIAAQAKAEADARAKREADQAHRDGIQQAICEALIALPACSPAHVADALMRGLIPHVQVML
jgi:hypothetical protein